LRREKGTADRRKGESLGKDEEHPHSHDMRLIYALGKNQKKNRSRKTWGSEVLGMEALKHREAA